MIQPMNGTLSTDHQTQVSRCLLGFRPKLRVQKVTKQSFVLQVADKLYCANAGLPFKPLQVAKQNCHQSVVLW